MTETKAIFLVTHTLMAWEGNGRAFTTASVQANTAMGRVGSGEMPSPDNVFSDTVQTFAPELDRCDRLTGRVD
jgi:hypothetical protein